MKKCNNHQMRIFSPQLRFSKMRLFTLIIMLFGFIVLAQAQTHSHSMPHEMQHGFVLSAEDTLGSHLVATGHHSRQAEIVGRLLIEDFHENKNYEKRKSLANGRSYFLFQAQNLDLPSLKPGQILNGHIVESQTGKYEPDNVIVKNAVFAIDRVLLNIPNPFFGEE